jgi:hypothetical protein
MGSENKKGKLVKFLRYEEVGENKWNVFFLYKQEPFIIQNVALKKRKGKETQFTSDGIFHNSARNGMCKLCKESREGICAELENKGEKVMKQVLTKSLLVTFTLLANKEQFAGLAASVTTDENLEKVIKIKAVKRNKKKMLTHFVYLKKDYCYVEERKWFYRKETIYEGTLDALEKRAFELENKKVINAIKKKKERL